MKKTVILFTHKHYNSVGDNYVYPISVRSMRSEGCVHEGFESYKKIQPSSMDAAENSTTDPQEMFEYVYGWNKLAMTIMGIWPEELKTYNFLRYRVLVPAFAMLSFICIPQTTNLFFIWGDFDLVVENLSLANMSITMALLKNVIFWYKKKPLKYLLECMAEDWKKTETNKKNRETMMFFRKISRMISIASTLLAQCVIVSCVAFRILYVRYNGRCLLFRAYFPFDSNRTPMFESLFACQILSLLFAALSYTSVDTFIAMLVLHVCGQLSNLQRELRELGLHTRQQFQTSLSRIVRRHGYLSWFSNTIEDCFNIMLLQQIISCTIQLCSQTYQALEPFVGDAEFSLVQFLFFLTYVSYMMLHIFLYCYIGEQLLSYSSRMIDAAYECDWYNMSAEEARLLIIIMCQAKSPFRITAGRFCSFTIELFSEILKKSMGYLSVLFAMKTKN